MTTKETTVESNTNKKNIIKFVSEKLKNKREKAKELDANPTEKANSLNDYALVFTGALSVLEELGFPETDLAPLNLVLESIETELTALEKEIALEKMLNGE